jgi:hypothetical protein
LKPTDAVLADVVSGTPGRLDAGEQRCVGFGKFVDGIWLSGGVVEVDAARGLGCGARPYSERSEVVVVA